MTTCAPAGQGFRGPWAGLPVAWTEAGAFDEETYRLDVRRCAGTRMPGVYAGGTTGEFYAMEFDEFRAVARATVEECHAGGASHDRLHIHLHARRLSTRRFIGSVHR